MTLCSPCSVSLSVHITDLIGECQRNICTSQRKANLFFLEKKVAEVPKSCKRLMPLDTVPIYICVVQSYSSNCYCIGKQTATMCLFWSIWCVVCSTAILISCFFTQNLSTCACGHANDLWIDVSSVQSLVEGGIPMIVCKNPSEVPWNHC